jgi:hypothetical protein
VRAGWRKIQAEQKKEHCMTALIAIWIVVLLVLIYVYRNPGYRSSRDMVKLYTAGSKATQKGPDIEHSDRAA